MACPLSNLTNKLSEGIYKIKSKNGHDNQNCETCGITYKVCDCFFENTNFKDDIIEFKYLCCNKNFQQKFDEKLKERFLIQTNFLTMISISLFYCCNKVFIFISIRMIGKNSMKHR